MNFKSLTFLLGMILLTTASVLAQEADGEVTKYKIITHMATPKGGLPKFYRYIRKKMKYPKEAKRAGIEGKVTLIFIVGKDGLVEKESVEVTKGLHPLCDAEAVRLIQKLPKWEPARLEDGTPLSQKISLPVNFKL